MGYVLSIEKEHWGDTGSCEQNCIQINTTKWVEHANIKYAGMAQVSTGIQQF